MRALLFAILLALLCCHVQARVYYSTLADADSVHNLYQETFRDIADLKAKCSKDPLCVGFSSDGWIKYDVTKREQSHGKTLYIKVDDALPNLVPMPLKSSVGASTLGVSNILSFTGATSSDLTAAFARFNALVFPHSITDQRKQTASGILQSITCTVQTLDTPLQLGVDESYSIDIAADGTAGTIQATTVYGVYHALQTLSQLIVFNFTANAYQILAPVTISDAPRFSHRGVLVDTSRHFEPVATLTSVIDSLTYAKLNVLHWHISDSQSFPMESKTYPLLWNGAYSPYERYTQDDIAYVVEYARQRGVRVMVEFDMPGHAGSWCVGYPNVCPSATCTQPLNPATNDTFVLINGLLGEITGGQEAGGLFFEDLLHLGGDEVDTSCWTSSPQISAWMTQHNYTADGAYMYFVLQAHKIAIAQGRIPVNWEEVFLHFGTQLDPRSIIHIWLDFATLAKVVAAGYRAILSNNDVWYLDHLDTTWEQFYLNEPFGNITDPKQQALIIGGEVCMWGETVDTSDIFQTIWPRAAAAAERLWSAAEVNDTNEFLGRLEYFRCLLNARGIAAAPTNNDQARENPPSPGSCYVQ